MKLEKKVNFKNLIIAPHADDEVLGCGGILGKDSFVYYCGIDESNVNIKDPLHRIPLNKRLGEIKNVAKFLDFKWAVNMHTKVNHYAQSESELRDEFEKIINTVKPEKIFIPFPSYNQDHKTVYEAALVALRPHDKNHFVKKVLVYEQQHPVLWEDKPFQVNYFVPIDIKKKIDAYLLHKSQVRSMRSPDLIEAIAKVRGKQSNTDFAEAFIIKRWVD
jgi:N-acetylglucosamine malate deacetylase 1